MKNLLLGMILLGATAVTAHAQSSKAAQPEPREFETKGGDTTYTMRRYVMVLLYKNKKADKMSKAEVDSIQAGHMANIGRLAKEGKLLVAGPMGDDTPLRGIFILDCENVAEAEALLQTDPAISSGRLRAECHPWWTARGTVIK